MAEGERAFLGLTHNPFVEPDRGFFERGGRKTHLEQLRHLSEWSRRILLVTGPGGVGKTTLYRELAATLEPKVKAARINGSLVSTGREVLSAVAQGFGLAVPAEANTQALRFSLLEHVEAQAAADRLCLTLIDDAHLLDNKAVEELIVLTHESSIHLVMFGEVRMVPTIERAASSKGVGWQEIRLTGYSDADARDYLEWRFQQARYRGRIPFTDHEVKDLVRLSEGLPGRMNQMANVLLVQLESGEPATGRSGFPRLHAALLALLVTMLGLFYVLLNDEQGKPDVSEVDAGKLEVAGANPVAETVVTDSVGSDVSAVDVEQTVIKTDVAVVTSKLSSKAVDELAGGEADQQVGELASARETGDLPAGESGSGESPATETAPGSALLSGPRDAALESSAKEVIAPGIAVEAEAPPNGVEASRPAAEELDSDNSTPPAEPPTGSRDSRWLLSQNPDYFTIQLVTVSSAERARIFVDQQQEPHEFTIYQLQRDGRVLHVVLYGLFSSRDAAQAAADRLPPEVGNVQAWIRQIEQVQGAARLPTMQ